MWRHYLSLTACQALYFLLLVANYRFIAWGYYGGTLGTEAAALWVNFTIIQRIAKSESRWDRVAITIGGVIGSALGLLVTGA